VLQTKSGLKKEVLETRALEKGTGEGLVLLSTCLGFCFEKRKVGNGMKQAQMSTWWAGNAGGKSVFLWFREH
jgi:hypothetical protein